MPDLRRCDWFAELDEWHAKDLEFGKWCGPLENPLRGRFILSRVCDQRSSFGGHAECSDRVRWLLSRDAGRWRAIAHISLADTKGEFTGMFMYISQKLVMTHRRLWSRRLNTRFGNWIRCCSSARWSGSNHIHMRVGGSGGVENALLLRWTVRDGIWGTARGGCSALDLSFIKKPWQATATSGRNLR